MAEMQSELSSKLMMVFNTKMVRTNLAYILTSRPQGENKGRCAHCQFYDSVGC